MISARIYYPPLASILPRRPITIKGSESSLRDWPPVDAGTECTTTTNVATWGYTARCSVAETWSETKLRVLRLFKRTGHRAVRRSTAIMVVVGFPETYAAM